MPKIVNAYPVNFSTDVIRNVFIKIQFDNPLARSSITSSSVLLVRDKDEELIFGVPDYVSGTYTLTFQLQGYLDKLTDYTFIIVGGDSGVKTLDAKNWSEHSFLLHFTTGEAIDKDIPLAPREIVSDAPVFSGSDGIYKIVWGRTGEPVTHIVTTGAQVGPSGTIVPLSPDLYIHPTEILDLSVISTNPENGASGISDINTITIIFDSSINIETIVNKISISAVNILGDKILQTFEESVNNNILSITFQENIVSSCVYTITLLSGIMSEDNKSQLKTDYIFLFSSVIAPFYSTVFKIRTLGNLINLISDNEIIKLIYSNSIYISEHAGTKWAEPSQVVIDYVTCKTKLDLIYGEYLDGGPVTSKRLADFAIERGRGFASVIGKMINSLEKCVEKNYLAITTGYSFIPPQSAVKSQYDPRYPKEMRLPNEGFS